MVAILPFLVLIALLLSVLPAWSYSKCWGYFPSCSLGLVLFIFLALLFRGVI
jgi:hypothetical protein